MLRPGGRLVLGVPAADADACARRLGSSGFLVRPRPHRRARRTCCSPCAASSRPPAAERGRGPGAPATRAVDAATAPAARLEPGAQAAAVTGAAPCCASDARSARRPRWCRPWTALSVRLQPDRDLGGSKAGEVAQHDDLALLLGQLLERGAQAVETVAVGARQSPAADSIGSATGHGAPRPDRVDRGVAGEAEQPAQERRAAVLVAGAGRRRASRTPAASRPPPRGGCGRSSRRSCTRCPRTRT